MKKTLSSIFVLFLLMTVTTYAQKPAGFKFDAADFSKKFEVAEWLVRYDTVAWKTTDVVMQQDKKELAKLGREWFCFEDKNGLWHAVYGKFADDKYETVFHLTMTKDSQVSIVKDAVDQNFLNAHARALATAMTKLAAATKDRDMPRFNQYIKQNADKSFSVWLLPAFQTNGMAVYGGEAIYSISADGKNVIKDESYFQKDFLGFKASPPREIWLNYRELEKPTLGAIFFVWYYKDYFTSIIIDNATSTSTVVGVKEKNPLWVHVEKKTEAKPEK
jgi:hypothetical protein